MAVPIRRYYLLIVMLACSPAWSASLNGFDLDNALIPVDEIVSGGPPRDGIPALTMPQFESVAEANWLRDRDRVLGITINGVARAYPIRILDWHEIVNDRIADQFITVTYCPLCGTGMVFAANPQEEVLTFGVSGLLYNSDMLLYDRNSNSLWSQIMGTAVAGPLVGTKLPQLPVIYTSWEKWKARFPDSQVLSRNTGFNRNYSQGPYGNYAETSRLMFEVSHRPPRGYHPKEYVAGVEIDNRFKAYPFTELKANDKDSFVDELAGVRFQVKWDAQAESVEIADLDGNPLPAIVGFWFAWYTFHPDTEVFKASEANRREPVRQ